MFTLFKRNYFFLLLFSILPTFILAQSKGPLFRDDIVPKIHITVSQDDYNYAHNNIWSNTEHPASFTFDNGTTVETVENIGFRLRGNTSREAGKKSYKLSINSFESGRRFHGQKKMNLNGEHNDPSVSRAKICWDLVRDFGLPGPRTNQVEVYINGAYHGLYISIEQYNNDFVDSRFGNKDGNLYKCVHPADLTWKGADPNNYKTYYYELKLNREENDYSDLVHFLNILNRTPVANFKEEIEKVFNVNGYLRALAVEVLTGHWDGYSYNKNNFYLYNNTETGKFEYILYDMDNTLGVDWVNRDWATRNIYDWANRGQPRPLTTRILAVPEFRDRFSFYIDQFLNRFFNEEYLFPRLDALKELVTEAAERDPYHQTHHFHDTWIKAIDNRNHLTHGIKEFISIRHQTAKAQLKMRNTPNYKLYINEFMASNGETKATAEGKYEDWIELYNGGNEPIYLGDKFLTDNLNRPEKYQMPPITIEPGEYIIFWADGSSPEEIDYYYQAYGEYHTSFALSRSGEQVGIFDAGFAVIDSLTFGEQLRDVSYGRFPNGTGPFYYMQNPTPGKPNTLLTSTDNIHSKENSFTAYPNPFSDDITLTFTTQPQGSANISISDLTGRIVYRKSVNLTNLQTSIQWDGKTTSGSLLPPGIYIIKAEINQLEKKEPLPMKKIMLHR
jgi:spore coat protein CotH